MALHAPLIRKVAPEAPVSAVSVPRLSDPVRLVSLMAFVPPEEVAVIELNPEPAVERRS